MAEFSYLRPLITKNFIFDFPSQFTTKEISDFSGDNYEKITRESSNLMIDIMSGTLNQWYIKAKFSNNIVGFIKTRFTNNKIEIKVDDNLSSDYLDEIGLRITELLQINLNFQNFTASSKINDNILTKLKEKYDLINQTFYLKGGA